MLVHYKATETATFDAEAPSVEMAFQFLAYCDSIFGVTNCGNCDAPRGHLRFKYRTAKGCSFYSVECTQCRHELKFSKQKPENGGKMYPVGWEEPYKGGSANDRELQVETPPNTSVRADASNASLW